jgi:hypothetical protein
MPVVSAVCAVVLASAVSIEAGMPCSPRNTIKKTFAGGTVVVSAPAGQTIDGNAIYTLTNQYQYLTIVSDGANWLIVGKTEDRRTFPTPRRLSRRDSESNNLERSIIQNISHHQKGFFRDDYGQAIFGYVRCNFCFRGRRKRHPL